MKKAALALIQELHNELIAIVNAVQSTEDYRTGFEKLKRWKDRAAQKISSEINVLEGGKLKNKSKSSFRIGDPVGNLVDEVEMYQGFLFALRDEIGKHPDDVLNRPMAESLEETEKIVFKQATGNNVFIVHGHDELNLYRFKELIRERYGLNPIVLASKAGKGRTLIEKFEDEAQGAAYAFVILTPDDIIKKNETEYGQARPNVIFELGWFYGCLGRDKVCILFKEGTKLHSDLDGISRIQFVESITEKINEIETELIDGKMLKRKK